MIGEFQIALIGIVIAVIIIVFGYNRWQESKHRRSVERAFSEDRPDVLFETPKTDPIAQEKPRTEPQIGSLEGVDADDLGGDSASLAPSRAAEVSAPILHANSVSAVSQSSVAQRMTIDSINTQIDTIVLVRVQHDLRFADWQDLLQGCKSISRNIRWEGFNLNQDNGQVAGQSAGIWEPLWANTDSSYQTLRGGLQLADRSGATEAVTIAKFAQVVATFANQFEGQIQKEENNTAAERAVALDALCAQTDVEIALNVAVNSTDKSSANSTANGTGIAPTKLRGLLQARGLQANDKGEYVHRDSSGQVLFSVRNRDAEAPTGLERQTANLQGISLVLDVPCTANPVVAFNEMAGMAQELSVALHGQVVDDNNRPLSFSGREQIAQSVADIAAQLQARGFAAGSPVAKRLFS